MKNEYYEDPESENTGVWILAVVCVKILILGYLVLEAFSNM